MSHEKRKNAASTTMENGVKSVVEATKLPNKHTTKGCLGAIYFWNHASHSVEPLRAQHGEAIL